MSFRVLDLSLLAVCFGAALACIGVGAFRVVAALGAVRAHAQRIRSAVVAPATQLAVARDRAEATRAAATRGGTELARARAGGSEIAASLARLRATAVVARATVRAVRDGVRGLGSDLDRTLGG